MFGKNAINGDNTHIVLDIFYDNRPPAPDRYFKLFPGRPPIFIIGPSRLMAAANARIIFYLSTFLAKYCSPQAKIGTDEEFHANWNGTFICLGSSDSNMKTKEILELAENHFYDFGFNEKGERNIVNNANGKTFNVSSDPPMDYGMIVKINNQRYPGNSLIVCAGLGEWGTSGAAYYLSSRWEALYKRYGNKSFGCIIRVNYGSDESVELVEYND
jgi:hypothetical protein